MDNVSLIYRNIWLYRAMMNVLYSSGYKKRFEKVIRVIEDWKPKSLLELCFGDVIIAGYCKLNNIKWTGIDCNQTFVKHAISKNLDAKEANLLTLPEFPKADVCVIMGSLYHFQSDIHSLLSKMLKATDRIVISEPVKNLSDRKNIVGRIARRSANAGSGNEYFRYDESRLIKVIEEESKKLKFNFKVIDSYKKDLIITIEKNGGN